MFSYKTPKICLSIKCHNLTYHTQFRQKEQAQNHRNLIPYNYPPYSHHFHSVHHVAPAVPIRLKLDDKKFPSRDLETRLVQNPRNSIGRGKKEGSEGFAFADPNITFRKQGADA